MLLIPVLVPVLVWRITYGNQSVLSTMGGTGINLGTSIHNFTVVKYKKGVRISSNGSIGTDVKYISGKYKTVIGNCCRYRYWYRYWYKE